MRVTTCDTDESLGAASGLFNRYRHHYGQHSDEDERTPGWLIDMVGSGMLTVYTAFAGTSEDEPPIGLATAHAVPASLAMGQSWQLRDLYVLPEARGRGAAAALVGAVRDAARAAAPHGCRLSLSSTTMTRSASTGGSGSSLPRGWHP